MTAPATSRATEPANAHFNLVLLAGWASVATAGLLLLAKLGAWLVTDSTSLLASLVDSLMDMAASLLNLLALRYAAQPPDEEHRFGHGKAEALAGLAQAMFITGSALFLLLHATGRLLHPTPIAAPELGLQVMGFSLVWTMGLVLFQRYVVRRTGSVAIRADSLHYTTDLLTGAAVLLAIWLSSLGWQWLDPVLALVIGLYILWGAGRIGYDAVQLLLDRELPQGEREAIQRIVLSHDDVLGFHGLRTRRSGATRIIQLDLELAAQLSLVDAHRISHEVKQHLSHAFDGADVTIHQDPVEPQAPLPAGKAPR